MADTWVNLVAGTPVARDFFTTNGNGAPLCIDTTAKVPYYLAAGDVPTTFAAGAGTVTVVSVTKANGFDGTVANSTTTPAITLTTTISGVLKGDGKAISAASAGTDYVAPGATTSSGLTMATARLLGRTTAATGAIEEISIGTGLKLASGSLSSTTTGTVTSVDVSGGTTGLTTSGGPVTSSGTITLAGTLGYANGGTGVKTTPTDGSILIGNGGFTPGYASANLTAGANISITNAANSITIAATGIIAGPGSSTDRAVVLWNGTKGDTLQNSNFLVNSAGIPALTCLTSLAGAIGAGIADYFSSTLSLDASSTYEITCVAYFLKTTAGTVTFTWTFSSAPTMASSFYTGTPATGFTTTTITGVMVIGEAHVQAQTTMAHAATASLTTAVYHVFSFKVTIRTNGATTIQLRATESAGTITPQTGSYMRAQKII